MKVECENLREREATPELIRELIRYDARRGEFMILMQDADEEAFVQIATGTVTLRLPKFGAKDHTRYRYYLRVAQKMKAPSKSCN